jgi:hypothetical protein
MGYSDCPEFSPKLRFLACIRSRTLRKKEITVSPPVKEPWHPGLFAGMVNEWHFVGYIHLSSIARLMMYEDVYSIFHTMYDALDSVQCWMKQNLDPESRMPYDI